MLRLLRVSVLVVVAVLLVEAGLRIASTTGRLEQASVAVIACVWALAARRELRQGLRRLTAS